MGADVLNHLVGQFDVFEMESQEQRGGKGGCLFWVRKITRKANTERMRNQIRNETKGEEIVL